jgi:Family of unknown function (DUF6941)
MPRVLIATLCDDVRDEVRGKNSLMGVFNQFTISDFRNPVNSFWIFARIEFEQGGEYPITFEFRTVEGHKIFEVQAGINIQQTRPSQIRPVGDLKFRVNALRFPRHGAYELAIRSKDTVLQTVPVEVVVPQTPYVQ